MSKPWDEPVPYNRNDPSDPRVWVRMEPNGPAILRPRNKPRKNTNKYQRAKVYARDGRVCQRCGATEHLVIDHITPVSLGGTNDLANLQVLCGTCNGRKHNRVTP